MKRVEVIGLQTIPEIGRGDDLPGIIISAAEREGLPFAERDILVLTSKVVSKAMGLVVHIADIHPGPKALALARTTGKKAHILQLIHDLGHEIVAMVPVRGMVTDAILRDCSEPGAAQGLCDAEGVMCITRDRAGRIFTQDAGIDSSNHPDGVLSYPPPDPDEAAEAIREEIKARTGVNVAVILADTEMIGPGSLDLAIGSSGIHPRPNLFGHKDGFGRPKFGGMDIVVHELSAAAGLLFGQLDAAIPAVIVRGYDYTWDEEANIANTLWSGLSETAVRGIVRGTLAATAHAQTPARAVFMRLLARLL